MKTVKIKDEFIKLGQAMKLGGMVGSGVEAKIVIQGGEVTLNGKTELQRGKKLHNGDVVSYNGETIQISQ
ncbi:MAG: RNA-binding S4 domain-containing protein [Eubacterium sp.]|nr:RNA-binding S4 domain-containing protein [Eubacterium sp.]